MRSTKVGLSIFFAVLLTASFAVSAVDRSNRQTLAQSQNIEIAAGADWQDLCVELIKKLEALRFANDYGVHLTEPDRLAALNDWQLDEDRGKLIWPSSAKALAEKIKAFKASHEAKREELAREHELSRSASWEEILEALAENYARHAAEVGLDESASRREIEEMRRMRAVEQLRLPAESSTGAVLAANHLLFEYLSVRYGDAELSDETICEQAMIKYHPLFTHPKLEEILESQRFPQELGGWLGHDETRDFEHLRAELQLEQLSWKEFFDHLRKEISSID